MKHPHLTDRKANTRLIISVVQQATEKERIEKDTDPFKTNQCDVVDKLIELGSKHRSVSDLLKRYSLKLPVTN